jgi:hypothetical protein
LNKPNLNQTWNDFEKACLEKSPYDLQIWKEIWLNHFSEDYDFEYIKNDNFFIPLKYKNSEASIIGDKDIVDYNNILYINNEKKDFEDLINQIFDLNINKLILYSISEESPTFNLLTNGEILNDYRLDSQQEDVSPYLSLPNSWDEYLTSLPKKKRHELKRKIRRIEQNADFSTGDLSSLEDKDEILGEFFRLHKMSSDEKNLFMTNEMEQFFTDLIIKMLENKSLTYSYLKIDNKTTACSISFIHQNIRFLYNSGFDPFYNNFSSGLLNHAFAIKRSIEDKLTVFDFMRGNERYKYDLGAVDKILYTFQISKDD